MKIICESHHLCNKMVYLELGTLGISKILFGIPPCYQSDQHVIKVCTEQR